MPNKILDKFNKEIEIDDILIYSAVRSYGSYITIGKVIGFTPKCIKMGKINDNIWFKKLIKKDNAYLEVINLNKLNL